MRHSKRTSMTLEEMRAARARGESKTDFARVRAAIMRGDEPAEDEDSPDASEALREQVLKRRPRGRPPVSDTPKIPIAFRCDLPIVAIFRACGPGWQARMNAALADWLKTHSPQELSI